MPARSRILFISHEGSLTGAPLALLRLVRFVSDESSDYELAIFFSRSGELCELLSREGFRVFVSNKRVASQSRLRAIFYRLIHYYRFLLVMCRYQPDLVYSNTIVNFGEVVLARLSGSPVVLHMHEGWEFARACRYRLNFTLLFVRHIFVGSDYVNRVLQSLTGRAGVVAYNGVEPLAGNPERRTGRSEGLLTIGTLGTIIENKGQLVAMNALRLVIQRGMDARLQIAGSVGSERYLAELEDFVTVNSLDKCIQFVGVVPDIYEFLKSLDLLVVPSYDEAFPTVILEAFASGTLVLASSVGGIPEMIDDGYNGFLFRPGDFRMLADSIGNIAANRGVLQAVPQAAMKVLKERFDPATTNGLILKYLEKMLRC